MKKVAGPLKLELAQYRELEAFAKFGSDLDKATQQQLRRGARLTEILKQKQFKPVPVDKQIVFIWTATNGYFDDINVSLLNKLEVEFFNYLDDNHKELLYSLNEKRELTKEIVDGLKKAVEPFINNFKLSNK